jgi:hypothetical protein
MLAQNKAMLKSAHRGVEKRKFLRLEAPLQVTLTIIAEDRVPGGVSRPISVKSRNISEQGVCIETRQIEIDGVHMLSGSPGAQKNRLDMAIELYGIEKTIQVIGEVCWYDLLPESENFMFQVGIVFLDMDSQDKDLLKSFLKTHQPRKKSFLRRIFSILY